MRNLSEHKLIACFLFKFYEKTGIDFIRYENAKILSNKVLHNLNKTSNNYSKISIKPKEELINNMINSGSFKKVIQANKPIFKQIKTFELSKYIHILYKPNDILAFKLADEAKKSDNKNHKFFQDLYLNDLTIEAKNIISAEINNFANKVVKFK